MAAFPDRRRVYVDTYYGLIQTSRSKGALSVWPVYPAEEVWPRQKDKPTPEVKGVSNLRVMRAYLATPHHVHH